MSLSAMSKSLTVQSCPQVHTRLRRWSPLALLSNPCLCLPLTYQLLYHSFVCLQWWPINISSNRGIHIIIFLQKLSEVCVIHVVYILYQISDLDFQSFHFWNHPCLLSQVLTLIVRVSIDNCSGVIASRIELSIIYCTTASNRVALISIDYSKFPIFMSLASLIQAGWKV